MEPLPAFDEASRGRHGRRSGRRRLPKSRWRRVVALVAVLGFLVVGGGGAAGWLYLRSLEKQVSHVDAFHGLRETDRPARVTEAALNILVVGKDMPEGGVSRTDTIMLVHVPSTHDGAQLISIPRDTWTTIPGDGARSATTAKINAAYAWGGTPLLVRTLENFTGVRIDHVVLIDFAGFGKIIDALGGVDVTVDRAFTPTVGPDTTYAPGLHHMDSSVALDYARQRKQFPDGDFSRMRHQQAIVAAVMQKADREGLLTNPLKLNDFVRMAAGVVQVDRDFPIFETVWALRQLGNQDTTMLTSPSSGTGMVGDQSVVFPDPAAADRLYQAVKTDTMAKWLAEHPQ
jgi:LCP family protein required for cell wall assembly